MYAYGTPRPAHAPLGPLSPPLVRATSHAAPDAETVRALGLRERHGDFYPRYGHQNARDFESAVATVEGADGAVSFASGMAAMHAVILALCSAGDRVLIAEQVYGGTSTMAVRDLPRFGIDVRTIDALDPAALERALSDGARLCVVETPVNGSLRVVDIAAVAAVCRAAGTRVVVDGTFAPPPIQHALAHGADLVVHSATKFLGGHADVLAGVVAGGHELLGQIEAFRARTGAVLAPDPAWLLCRSMATLELRVRAQQDAARDIAAALRERAAAGGPILAVCHPGAADHPDAALVARQMQGGAAIFNVEVAGGLEAAMRAFDRLRVVGRGPSLGGVESLASLPAHTTHASLSREERLRRGIPDGTIRISVGLEGVAAIRDDLLAAIGLG